MLADFENEKQVHIEVVQLDQLFLKMQEAHDMYLNVLDDDNETELTHQWYDTRDNDVSTKAKNYWLTARSKEVSQLFTWHELSEILSMSPLKGLSFLIIAC